MLPFAAHAQGKIEKPKVSIAVGGKTAFYYLPLTIAERLSYFKDEGLEVEISDFDGGSKALQAVVGGSADVVSGAWENTIDQQPKGLSMQGFVLQGRYPAISRRHRQGQGGQLQVAQGSQGHEDRRQRAGLEHQPHGAASAREGRPQGRRRLDHRRRHLGRRDRGDRPAGRSTRCRTSIRR